MQHVYYNLVSGDVSVDCVVGGGSGEPAISKPANWDRTDPPRCCVEGCVPS